MGNANIISLRISEEKVKNFDKITKIFGISRTEFFNSCIDKLVLDNVFYLKNLDEKEKLTEIKEKVKKYIKITKNNFSNEIKITEGTIDSLNDLALISFLDFLFSKSKKFYNSVKDVYESSNIQLPNNLKFRLNKFSGSFLLDIEDSYLLSIPAASPFLNINGKSEKNTIFRSLKDIANLDSWTDFFQVKLLMLLIGAEKFMMDNEPPVLVDIISKILKESYSGVDKEKRYLIINSKGNYIRYAGHILNPTVICRKSQIKEILKQYDTEYMAKNNEL